MERPCLGRPKEIGCRWGEKVEGCYRLPQIKHIEDKYPLPNISDIMDYLGNTKLFTTLDLASGFHQIPVVTEHQEKTAFSTPTGHYEFTRMPYGICNAPRAFQRIINNCLQGLLGAECFIYVNDIINSCRLLPDPSTQAATCFQSSATERFRDPVSKMWICTTSLSVSGTYHLQKGTSADAGQIGKNPQISSTAEYQAAPKLSRDVYLLLPLYTWLLAKNHCSTRFVEKSQKTRILLDIWSWYCFPATHPWDDNRKLAFAVSWLHKTVYSEYRCIRLCNGGNFISEGRQRGFKTRLIC